MNGFPSTRRISQERYLRFPAAAKKKTSRNERPVCTLARPFFFFWKLGNIRRDA
jgi:hypothetical protein